MDAGHLAKMYTVSPIGQARTTCLGMQTILEVLPLSYPHCSEGERHILLYCHIQRPVEGMFAELVRAPVHTKPGKVRRTQEPASYELPL